MSKKKPILLDLFSGAGGAAAGYAAAGFEVVGVDNRWQPNYPYEFHKADAFEFLKKHWEKFDAVHTSPPCQRYTLSKTREARMAHPNYIPKLRRELNKTGLPWVIENVLGAPMLDPIELCGEMFGLRVIRHRLFETNWKIKQPIHVKHHPDGVKDGYYFTIAGHGNSTNKIWSKAIGIYWMNKLEMAQAIPPAYTKYLGKKLIKELNESKL